MTPIDLLNAYKLHILGALHDASGSHYNGFFLAGSSMILSGVLFMLVALLVHMKKNDNQENNHIPGRKSAAAIIGSAQNIMTQSFHSAQNIYSALEWQNMAAF